MSFSLYINNMTNNNETSPTTVVCLNHILKWHAKHLEVHKASSSYCPPPLIVGISACQGSGKTTLCRTLVQILQSSPYNLNVITFSLDDLLLTHSNQIQLASQNPTNRLLELRGNPGTHDLTLINQLFGSLVDINSTPSYSFSIPAYDKSLHSGRGDRLPINAWPTAISPVDLILFEGWCLGFRALNDDALSAAITAALPDSSLHHYSYDHLATVNYNLRNYEKSFYSFFDCFIHIIPQSLGYVHQWRLQQEHDMCKNRGVTGMTDDEVKDFVDRYMPAYELYMPGLTAHGFFTITEDTSRDIEQRHLRIVIDKERKPLEMAMLNRLGTATNLQL